MTEITYSLPVIETVKSAWAKVSGAKGSIWAIFGLFFLAILVTEFLGKLFAPGLFSFIGTIIQLLAGAGLVYLGVRRAQDIPINFNMAKDVITLRIFLFIVGLLIIETLIYIPAGILSGIGFYFYSLHPQAEPSIFMFLIIDLLYLASFILFIYLTIRMWLGYAFIVDKKLNPWEAIQLSFKMTSGNVWNIIGLFAIKIGVLFLCSLTLGIGFIWGLPWVLITYGEAYKRLSSRQDIRHIH